MIILIPRSYSWHWWAWYKTCVLLAHQRWIPALEVIFNDMLTRVFHDFWFSRLLNSPEQRAIWCAPFLPFVEKNWEALFWVQNKRWYSYEERESCGAAASSFEEIRCFSGSTVTETWSKCGLVGLSFLWVVVPFLNIVLAPHTCVPFSMLHCVSSQNDLNF